MNIINSFFEYAVIPINIINTIVYLFSLKNIKKNNTYTLFCIYLLCALIINISVITLASFKEHNLFLSHYYFILQFILLSLFYRTLFEKHQKLLVDILLIMNTIILTIQYVLTPELYFKFNTTEVFITCAPIVIYSVIHLYNSLSKSSKFMYINIGILVYLTISTLIFILGDYLSEVSYEAGKNIWFFNKVMYVFYLILIFTEWWKNFRVIKNK